MDFSRGRAEECTRILKVRPEDRLQCRKDPEDPNKCEYILDPPKSLHISLLLMASQIVWKKEGPKFEYPKIRDSPRFTSRRLAYLAEPRLLFRPHFYLQYDP